MQPVTRSCRQCGAENAAETTRCWLCGGFVGEGSEANRPVPLASATNPCPQCGSAREAIDVPCHECGWMPAPARELARSSEISITWPMKLQAARTFSLESMLLTMTLVAVCVGVLMLAPGIGILLAVLSAPALVRTIGIRIRKKAVGQPLSSGEKLLAFLGSLVVVVTISVVSCVTFLVVGCSFAFVFPVFIFGRPFFWALTFGSALTVGGLLFRWLWRRKR